MTNEKAEGSRKKRLLAKARQHWAEATGDATEIRNRERGREDARFSAGGDDGAMWDPRVLALRRTQGKERPAVSVNKCQSFLHRIENEVRENKIAIKVSPVDSGIDKDIAAVDQGLVRHIENEPSAESAGHAALVEACRSGLGALKVVAQYVSDDSFDQELVIEHIPNAIGRFWFDPYAKKPDRSDGRYAFEIEKISRGEFEEQHPDSETVSSAFFDGFPQAEGWITSDDVQKAHYWYKDVKKRKLLYLSGTGESVFKDELPDGELPEGVTAEKERDVLQSTIRCCTFNGVEVLEEREWPGQIIPLVAVLGEEIMVDDHLQRYSLIHFIKDSQRLYNYYRSSEAEMVGLAPKVPWVMVEGQDEGYEYEWRTANDVHHSTLHYRNVSLNGTPAPPPQRTQFAPQIEALSLGAAQCNDDMKAITGINDASLGARSNETSGIAIQRRQAEGNLSNLHFIDNLKRAKTCLGQIIVAAKPFYYDTARQIEILGEDMKPKVVRINEEYLDAADGRTKHYPIADTKNNVNVATAKSYQSAREEAFLHQIELIKAAPELMMVFGDLMLRNSDSPGAEECADRLKKAIDPKLTAEEKDGEAKIPPAVKATLVEMDQTIAGLTEQLNKATEALNGKREELESKERIAFAQMENDLTIAERKLGSVEGVALLREDMASIKHALDLDREQRAMDAEQQHAKDAQAAEHGQENVAQMQDQAHAQSMQEQSAQAAEAQQLSAQDHATQQAAIAAKAAAAKPPKKAA